MGCPLLAIIGFSAIIRFHSSAFLDPFEDGYQNWWISANLASTGQYWDRHSMMTQGNWLPLYHFSGAGLLEIVGLMSMEALMSANVALSSLTSVVVCLIDRKRDPSVGLGGGSLYSFNVFA